MTNPRTFPTNDLLGIPASFYQPQKPAARPVPPESRPLVNGAGSGELNGQPEPAIGVTATSWHGDTGHHGRHSLTMVLAVEEASHAGRD